jgi:hypothetical protein
MLDIRRKDDHYHHTRSWLKTDWHFSFGEYRDPDNMNFGPLRVVNNDRIDGGGGFPMHSHEDMEILTWVIEGELVHEDSTGAKESIGRNGLQKMSAGSGISHSEYNGSESGGLHLVQIWIEPNVTGIEPYYQDAVFSEDALKNELVPIASDNSDAPVDLEQDATLLVGHLDQGTEISYELNQDRRGYLIVLKGRATLNDRDLSEGDAVRIKEEAMLRLGSEDGSELLLMDLP